MKRNINCIIVAVVIGLGSLSVITSLPVYANSQASIKAPSHVKVKRASDNSLKLQWKQVAGAKGYAIYRYHTKKKTYRKVKTIKKRKTVAWTNKKLKQNTKYTYKVKAYTTQNGKKVYSNFSHKVSARTYRQGAKTVNAGAIKTNRKNVTLGLKMSKTVKATVKASSFSRAKNKKPLSKKVRWSSSNPNIATVDQKGKIKAGVRTGQCIIYAMAHNGNRVKVKIKVKDYAKPKSFDLDGVDEIGRTVLSGKYKPMVCNLASHFSTHHYPIQKLSMTLDDTDHLKISPSVDLGSMKSKIESFLLEFPHDLTIGVNKNTITFTIKDLVGVNYEAQNDYNFYYITYHIYEDYVESEDGRMFCVAPHWSYFMFVPI